MFPLVMFPDKTDGWEIVRAKLRAEQKIRRGRHAPPAGRHAPPASTMDGRNLGHHG
jgi:hypothetical protein